MAYVYRHIRLDKNEPFYIGIGNCKKCGYPRAHSKFYRNKMWLQVLNESKISVEIIMDGLSYEEAKTKEKEFIKLYGRKDTGSGSLVNMTSGGQGAPNRTKSVAGTNNPMYGKRGKDCPAYGRNGDKHPLYGKIGTARSRKIAQVNPLTEEVIRIYESINSAAEINGFGIGNIYNAALNKYRMKTAYGYKWKVL